MVEKKMWLRKKVVEKNESLDHIDKSHTVQKSTTSVVVVVV